MNFSSDTRILLVEDTPITRKIVTQMLVKLGFTNVVETADGEEAWKLIDAKAKAREPFQLILADWNLPSLSGLLLVKRVRESRLTKTTPFIMFTSNISKDQVIEAVKAGVNAYIAKPFVTEGLEKKLRETWEQLQKKRVA